MTGLEIILTVFGFLFGASFGSFFNVIIYRLPREESIVMPASHCMKCNEPIKWFDNLPLLSYIILGGKCRHCKAPYSIRYFFVELLTGALFALVVNKYFYLMSNGTYSSMLAMVILHFYFMGGFVVLTFIDIDHKIIPNEITFSGVPIGLLASLIFPWLMMKHESHLMGLLLSFIGALVGGGFLYVVGAVGKKIMQKEVMGFGDVKLLAMIGAFIGWKLTLLTIILSSFAGTLIGIVLIVSKKAEWSSQIPFGPYIVLGALISFFVGDSILNWYLGFFQQAVMQ
jgi:leader peptidase (prepilin peptidase) / N-methyltransferase